jgi:hypothetical protein
MRNPIKATQVIAKRKIAAVRRLVKMHQQRKQKNMAHKNAPVWGPNPEAISSKVKLKTVNLQSELPFLRSAAEGMLANRIREADHVYPIASSQ